MTAKIMTIQQLKEGAREAVLDALDTYVREMLGHDKARGWTDEELPALFAGVDAHAKALMERINKGEEPGSASVTVVS